MLKIPYGIANYERIRRQKYFYQDKTKYIEYLEERADSFLVFLRPRRFGKSLFVSMLKYYYSVLYKDKFEMLFGDLYIGKNPTAMANEYLVLHFDFSGIDTSQKDIDIIRANFLTRVCKQVEQFCIEYESILPLSITEQQHILAHQHANDVLYSLLTIIRKYTKERYVYVLIDEYDHFTNELVTSNIEGFKSSVTRNGFFRAFFEVLKSYAGFGLIERIFITGVTPLTLDSLTSGFNISTNITMDTNCHEMMGFVEHDVATLLQKMEISEAKIPSMMLDLKDWYDGYIFSYRSQTHLYNTDMVLYFLSSYAQNNSYPENMLDNNIASSYKKIENIFRIGNRENANFESLQQFLVNGEINAILTSQFNLERDFGVFDVWSMLFYMGMTTVKSTMGNIWTMKMPNYVIKKLYFEYFMALLLRSNWQSTKVEIEMALQELLLHGNIAPFAAITSEALEMAHSNRDKVKYGEKHLKTLILGLLFPYESYLIHSEYETNSTYPDIFLERIPQANIPFEIVIELKYIKKENASDTDLINKVILEGTNQLNGYMSTPRFNRPDVKGFCLVFVGNDCQCIINYHNK